MDGSEVPSPDSASLNIVLRHVGYIFLTSGTGIDLTFKPSEGFYPLYGDGK